MQDLSDKRYFSLQITKRFLEAMDKIIGRKGEEKVTARSFGEIVGMASSNLSRMRMNPGENFVTIEACGRLCYYYNISPTWLLMDHGSMEVINGKDITPLEMIKSAVAELEKGYNKKSKKKPQTTAQTKK